MKLITTHTDYILLVSKNEKLLNLGDKIIQNLKSGQCAIFTVIAFKDKDEENMCNDKKQVVIAWDGKNYSQTIGNKQLIIIAHLPLNNALLLEGVDLLPELLKQEDDIEQLARTNPNITKYSKASFIPGFIEGYNANTNKWSDEDIEAAVVFGKILERFKDDKHRLSDKEELDGFLKSLHTTSLPTEFISEYEDFCQLLKTTNTLLCSRCQTLSDKCRRCKTTKVIYNGVEVNQLVGNYK